MQNKTKSTLLLELRELHQRLRKLETEKDDLRISLETSTEHGDLIEYELLNRLAIFRQQFEALEQEKKDLELSLQVVTETTDLFQNELLDARDTLEIEVRRRTSELAENNLKLQAEIAERERAEAQLKLAASVFQASREGIVITDANCHIILINEAFTKLTGYTEFECLGRNPNLLKSGLHEEFFYQNMWEAIDTLGHWGGEIWNRRKNVEVFSCWLSISAVKSEGQQVTHYIGIMTDNTHQRLSEQRIYQLSHYDALTTLPNRALFQDRLQVAIKRAHRENYRLALLFIDLDNFKDVNTAFSHPTGDQLLQNVAHRLLACVNDDNDAVARLGGDEFVVLLDNLKNEQTILQNAADMADRLLRQLQRPFLLEGFEIFISATIGISLYPEDGDDIDELLKHADNAMFEAKQQGRNNYHFYSKPMNVEARKRLTMQNGLRRALENDEFYLCYQPQLDAKTRRVIGAEALIRWQHPQLGLISPNDFIPLAESTGLIIPIGEWALRIACEQNKRWQNEGLPPIRVAVNLSVRQFYHQGLLSSINAALQQSHLDPRWLELEITETLAMTSADKTLKKIQALQDLGISMAIDDFGTGYSSLNYLKQFSLDILKIDKSFIGDIHSTSGKALISTIINMAHSLGMHVTAEGVETLEQLEELETMACEYIQGFIFYKPLLKEDMQQLLIRENSKIVNTLSQ
ncbi:putative bifunctional diguanylate cyclase/phosphodiesterase [Beggiatoa leptomitoformis]|uniref:cyclic-guanylate-specific phosphodiesterase n=1 Tax=Beggiatoa leptomitoformis TaxID=288004 RepID=A0A650GCR0_9GAMM|nr:EAL domain-containing protein [Beggiatoa leptomitoformis]QGX03482.1 EAL domain-containing protein [Beggiatoa leptomitoformis]QGX04030.1 EAL domain-containing protein [Beggiatoa leptomitoformis]